MSEDIRITDGSLDFSQGVEDGKVTTVASAVANPNGILRTQVCWLNNGTVRGNGISPRPGWEYLATVQKGVLYQGGWLYEPLIGNPYLVLSCGGRIYQIRVDTDNSVHDITGASANPATPPQAYFCQAEQFLVIQAGDWQVNEVGTLPLFWDGTKMRRSVGVIGPNNIPDAYPIQPYNEIPAALAMVYYQDRLWYANGRIFAAGDIVGNQASGTIQYNFDDSVLKVTENPLAIGGDGFTVPSQAGQITGMSYTAALDQTLGQGPLYVFTRKQIYQLVVPVTRADWIAAGANNQPQQTLAQKKYGATSDRCIFAVNGDLYYGSPEPGLRSLVLATRWFGQPGNVAISRSVQRAFKFTTPTLLGTQPGIEFDNRALIGVLPTPTPVGVAFQGVIALDFDIISTLTQKLPPAYDGLWDGLDILQMFEGDFGGLQRAFAIVHSRIDGSIQVWEITQNFLRDAGDNRIQWRVEFPAYTFGEEFKLKKLDGGELWLDKVQGTVELIFEFRVDANACWQPWMTTQFCSARNTCEDVNNPACYPVQPYCDGQKFPITLPAPNAGDGVSANLRPGNIGYQFQLRLTVVGNCRVRGLILFALAHDRRPFEGMINSTTPTQPNPSLFSNEAQSVTIQCPGDITLSDLAGVICLNQSSSLNILGGGVPATSYNYTLISGGVPTGMTFNGGVLATGTPATIIGTPNATGSFTFGVQAIDSNGNILTKTYTICVSQITVSPTGSDNSHLPPFTIGTPYSANLAFTSCAGTATFSVFIGSLPHGLTLSSNGSISGTPANDAISETFTIVATTASGTCSQSFTCSPSPSGINFNNLVWTNDIISHATLVTANNSFDGILTRNPTFNSDIEFHATMPYAGPLVVCNLRITKSTTGTADGNLYHGIQVFDNLGNSLLLIDQTTPIPDGVSNWPFTVPLQAGGAVITLHSCGFGSTDWFLTPSSSATGCEMSGLFTPAY